MNEVRSDAELPPFVEKAYRALREAAAGAIAEHWRAGRPVYVWRNQQVTALYPDGSAVPVEKTAAGL